MLILFLLNVFSADVSFSGEEDAFVCPILLCREGSPSLGQEECWRNLTSLHRLKALLGPFAN